LSSSEGSGLERKITVDALVIGSGPGGYHAAIRLGQLGKSVILVEKENLGGVCLNVGCIPSKALISASKLVKNARNASRMGINATVSIDLAKLQEWKQGVVNKLTSGVALLCKVNRVQVLKGTARFLSSSQAEILSKDSDRTVIDYEDVVIATGSSPIELPGLKYDGFRIITSTEALELDEPPKRLLIVGGGAIGLEIGMAYANLFGTQLTIIELLDQLLPGTDPELVNVVSKSLQKLGAKIFLKSKVTSAEVQGSGVSVAFMDSSGTQQSTEADYVLVSVGRRPNSKGLELDKLGVWTNEKGFVEVDDKTQTNVPHVYAIGDVTGNPLLAHKAMKQGIVAAEVISGMKSSFDNVAIPSAIFTDPEIATVGSSEPEALEKGFQISTGRFPYSANGRALASPETDGFTKIVAEKDSGVVLGIGIVGAEASDLISEGSLALEMGATLEEVGLTIHPHPTLSETIMEAAENALGKAIHIQNKRPSFVSEPKRQF
jgi:dihydrolipoamide dehydrogenase